MKRRQWLAALAPILVGGLAGCGKREPHDVPTGPPPPERFPPRPDKDKKLPAKKSTPTP